MTETLNAKRTLIRVRGLTATSHRRTLVDNVDLDIVAGEVTAIIGSSGSGKTTSALALMGEHRPGVCVQTTRHDAGGVRFGYVPQHPSAVLAPGLRIGTVLRDIARAAHRSGRTVSIESAVRRAGFPADPKMLRRYPHQLSGGQQQRLVIAQTLLTDPNCLVMDEPTTGQDPVNRNAVLDEIARLSGQGLAVVLLTHDLEAVRAVARNVIVMAEGRVVEAGDVGILDDPAHPQTQGLVDADARMRREGRMRSASSRQGSRLTLDSVTAGFGKRAVVQEFSLSLDPGDSVALVGPSGCGKSTVARVIAGLHRPTAGRVLLDGRAVAGRAERRTRSEAAAIAYVFQDAKAAFDPFRSVWEQIVRGPVRLRGATRSEAEAAASAAIEQVGLDARIARERASTLSGGEAQRAAIARALAVTPSVLICDEVTTGLDTVSQRRVLDILSDLTKTQDVSLVMISHDAGVVQAIADDVVDLSRISSPVRDGA